MGSSWVVQEFYTFVPGEAFRTRFASLLSQSPSEVPAPALNRGWRSKARATVSASPGEMLPRLRWLRAGGPRGIVWTALLP